MEIFGSVASWLSDCGGFFVLTVCQGETLAAAALKARRLFQVPIISEPKEEQVFPTRAAHKDQMSRAAHVTIRFQDNPPSFLSARQPELQRLCNRRRRGEEAAGTDAVYATLASRASLYYLRV